MKVISKLISWVFLNYDQVFKIVYQETSKYNLNIKSVESNALLKKNVYDNKFYVTSSWTTNKNNIWYVKFINF